MRKLAKRPHQGHSTTSQKSKTSQRRRYWVYSFPLLAGLLFFWAWAAGCAGTSGDAFNRGGSAEATPLAKGQSRFDTKVFISPKKGGNANVDAGVGAPPPQGKEPDSRFDPNKNDILRPQLEEADIYRVSGQWLYLFNTYKGFLVYNISNPKAPKRVASLPVYGVPVGMYVDQDNAYLLVRDVFSISSIEGQLRYTRRHTSQLVSVDLRQPSAPKVLQRLDIQGQLKAGSARRIEGRLYVVATQQGNYPRGWSYEATERRTSISVHAFQIQNPRQMRMLAPLNILSQSTQLSPKDPGSRPNTGADAGVGNGGGGNGGSRGDAGYSDSGTGTSPDSSMAQDGGTTSPPERDGGTNPSPNGRFRLARTRTGAQDTLLGITITSMGMYLLVTEQWQMPQSIESEGCTLDVTGTESRITLIELSGNRGTMRLLTRFRLPGQISDANKQTVSISGDRKRSLFFGLFTRQLWAQDCSRRSIKRNMLLAMDITSLNSPQLLDEITVGADNTPLEANLFDLKRGLVTATTGGTSPTLHLLNVTTPERLSLRGRLRLNQRQTQLLHQIGPQGEQILLVGQASKSECASRGASKTASWNTQVMMSVIETQDPSKPFLVQRRCALVSKAQNATAQLRDENGRLDQAHKRVGLFADASLRLCSVPIQYQVSVTTRGWTRTDTRSAIGLMRWDLSNYKANDPKTYARVLQVLPTLEHPDAGVKRTFFVSSATTGNGKNRSRLLFNLSETYASIFDVSQPEAPKALSTIEIAPYISGLYRFGNYVVEQAQSGPKQNQRNVFRVRRASSQDFYGSDARQAPTEREEQAKLGQIEATFEVGGVHSALPFRNALVLFREATSDNSNYVAPKQSRTTELRLIDLSDPKKPKMGGRLSLPKRFQLGYRVASQGFDPAFKVQSQARRQWVLTQQGLAVLNADNFELLFLDLRVTERPTLQRLSFSTRMTPDELVPFSETEFYVVLRQDINESNVRYFIQRLSLRGQQWQRGELINIPGRLVGIKRDAEGQILFITVDEVESLDRVDQDRIRLQRVHLLREERGQAKASIVTSQTIQGQLTQLLLDGGRLYLNTRPTQRSGGHTISIFDINAKGMQLRHRADTRAASLGFLGAYRQRLLLEIPDQGVIFADVTRSDRPKHLYFQRTLGWNSHIVFTPGAALLSAGHTGISRLPLP